MNYTIAINIHLKKQTHEKTEGISEEGRLSDEFVHEEAHRELKEEAEEETDMVIRLTCC